MRPQLENYSHRETNHVYSQQYVDDLNKYIDQLEEKSINILVDLKLKQQEIISSPVRFNGVSIADIEEIFEKYGTPSLQQF